MKSVEHFSRAGIRDLRDLRDALALAMKLEFATIPPYLCAKWSIAFDPDRVEGTLHHIVSQEMNHLALAGNLLSAIGGHPKVCRNSFLPKYPMTELPGGIVLQSRLDLSPLSFEQLMVFMNVEMPEFPPLAITEPAAALPMPATIGDFYDAIIDAFRYLQPKIHSDANQIAIHPPQPITSVDSAIQVMIRIKEEGEGTSDSPEQPSTVGTQHAHYYLFKEVYRQRRLVWTGAAWDFKGATLVFPGVHVFSSGRKSSIQKAFRDALRDLLNGLDAGWRDGSPLNVASMFRLNELGKQLVRDGRTPQFSIALRSRS